MQELSEIEEHFSDMIFYTYCSCYKVYCNGELCSIDLPKYSYYSIFLIRIILPESGIVVFVAILGPI